MLVKIGHSKINVVCSICIYYFLNPRTMSILILLVFLRETLNKNISSFVLVCTELILSLVHMLS